MVSTKKFIDLFRVCYIIIRNHCNTFLLIKVQKTKTCSKLNTAAKAICSDVRLLTVQTFSFVKLSLKENLSFIRKTDMEEGFALINMSKYKRWKAFSYRMIEKKNNKKESRLIDVKN